MLILYSRRAPPIWPVPTNTQPTVSPIADRSSYGNMLGTSPVLSRLFTSSTKLMLLICTSQRRATHEMLHALLLTRLAMPLNAHAFDEQAYWLALHCNLFTFLPLIKLCSCAHTCA